MPPARSENVRVERMGVRRAVVATPGRAARTSSAVTGEDSTVATSVRLSLARGTPWGMEALGTPETLLPNVATLAEGPRWETRTQRLLWVDIEGRALHEYDPEADEDRAIPLPARVGAAAPTQDPGRVLVALEDRLAIVDLETGDLEPLAEFPHGREGMRANDGDVDPAGRFWIGTMCQDEAPDRAALYRYDPDGTLTPVLAAGLASPTASPGPPASSACTTSTRRRSGSTCSTTTPRPARSRTAGRSRSSRTASACPTASRSTSRTASGSRSTAARRSAATGPAARSTRSSTSRPTT